MTTADLDRLERTALAQFKDIGVVIQIMPSELLALVRLARIGLEATT